MVQGSKFVSYCNALALHPLGLLAGILPLCFIVYRIVSANFTIFFYCSRSIRGVARVIRGGSRSTRGEARTIRGGSRSIRGEARTVRGVARIIRGRSRSTRGEASGKGVDVLMSECADMLMG